MSAIEKAGIEDRIDREIREDVAFAEASRFQPGGRRGSLGLKSGDPIGSVLPRHDGLEGRVITPNRHPAAVFSPPIMGDPKTAMGTPLRAITQNL
jgi:hypothetical protein